jgi:hypothetical protein
MGADVGVEGVYAFFYKTFVPCPALFFDAQLFEYLFKPFK